MHNPKCFSNFMGKWCIQVDWFTKAVEAVQNGTWPIVEREARTANRDKFSESLYDIQDGVAIIQIEGPMMKGYSKYGGTSTVETRQAIRGASANPDVRAIALLVDSPGGTVAGTSELAMDIRNANQNKPVYTHFEDLGASAAYWVGSQARQVSASSTTELGSVGTYAVVTDSSGMAEMAGVKVHVISTGDFKGAFVPGTEITDAQLEQLQTEVDDLNEHFLRAVSFGRGMELGEVRSIADGRVWIAAKAKKLGLIDKVQSFDATMEQIQDRMGSRRKAAALAIASRKLGIKA